MESGLIIKYLLELGILKECLYESGLFIRGQTGVRPI